MDGDGSPGAAACSSASTSAHAIYAPPVAIFRANNGGSTRHWDARTRASAAHSGAGRLPTVRCLSVVRSPRVRLRSTQAWPEAHSGHLDSATRAG